MNDTTTPAPLAVLPATGCTCGRVVEAAFLDKARAEGRKSMVCKGCKARWAVPPAAPVADEGVDLGGGTDTTAEPPLVTPPVESSSTLASSIIDEVAKRAVEAGAAILYYLFSVSFRDALLREREDVVALLAAKGIVDADNVLPRHTRGGDLRYAVDLVVREVNVANALPDGQKASGVTAHSTQVLVRNSEVVTVGVCSCRPEILTRPDEAFQGEISALRLVQQVTWDRKNKVVRLTTDWHADRLRQSVEDNREKVRGPDLATLFERLVIAEKGVKGLGWMIPASRHEAFDRLVAAGRALEGSVATLAVVDMPLNREYAHRSALEDLSDRITKAEADVTDLVDPNREQKVRASTLAGRVADLDELRGLILAHQMILEADVPVLQARIAALGEKLAEAAAKGA